MNGFEDVNLAWGDEVYTVPSEKVFELVRKVETTLMDGGTVPAFALLLNNRVPQSVLASAYAEALAFAGATVSGAEVYLSIMNDFAKDAAGGAAKVQSAIVGLLMIISPPMAAEIVGSEPEKK